jgi:hypothetical protein
MASRSVVVAVLTVACLAPRVAVAWGFDAHRFITERAIERLPREIRPFFMKHAAFIVERSVDPDLWRNAGFDEEPPRHFVDLDAYGTYPFAKLPHEYDLAVQRFGRETIEKNGTLPWRAGEVYGQLVRAFDQQASGSSRWAGDNVKFYAAVLSHYTADAYVPLHAVLNYDGQLTGQHGLHARFETDLFVRYRERLRIQPATAPPVAYPRDFVFDVLLASFQGAKTVLDADRKAIDGQPEYDDAYFERFWAGAGGVLQSRISLAIGGVAAMIVGAWEQGGRPTLPLEPPTVVQKRRATTQD